MNDAQPPTPVIAASATIARKVHLQSQSAALGDHVQDAICKLGCLVDGTK